jgi:prevent-host-death family protein
MKILSYKPVYQLVDRPAMPKPRLERLHPSHVGAFEAKTRFGELLSRVVEDGESVTITHRGTPVAKLVPIGSEVREPAQLLRSFRAFQEAHALEGVTTRELVEEGRA